MKKSSLIICLSIFGYIFSISSTDNILFDCEFGKECVVNMESFTDGYIPEYTNLYFRFLLGSKKQNAITIKLLNEEDYPSTLDVYFFSKKPTDEEAISGRSYSDYHDWIHEEEKEKDKAYSKYIYPIDEDYTGKYIVVTFNTYVNYHYLSILLSSYKEKAYYMREIEYNKEHVIQNIENYQTYYQFWLKTENNDNESIRIKLHKDDSDSASEITMQLAGMEVSPYQMKDNSDIIDSRIFQMYDSNQTDNDYIKYYYSYSKLKDKVKYLYLIVVNEYRLKYFSIGIGNNITDYIDNNDNNNDNSGYLTLIPLKYASFTLLMWLL